jgi:hypothetical protein
MTPDDFSDEILESTSSDGLTPASQRLRDVVLDRTTRTIRNRQRLRRGTQAITLVACYLGGIATVALWPAARTVDRFEPGSAVASVQNREPVAGTGARRAIRPEDDQIAVGSVPLTAARLTPYDRLRRAGDQQLEKHDDIPAAIRNYKRALQLASSDQLRIAPDHDTWLLMALKQSTN